ncbi:MAG TPA: 2-dehydro-3-deoxyglucarate aldolase [Elusimicrobia bacterium]|jgi:2-keto-3-deoxy-L-rhamnonate aldolase RhmA|nr:2-dehydro-3-deoxyglucarate aldolase [Elusimicrobiota bacterium]
MDAQGKRNPNRLKRDLAAGKVCLGATITIHSPVVAEIMSHIGFDWLWFETEHSTLNLDNVLGMLQTTNGTDISTAIRVPWNDKTMIKQALDTGTDVLIIPLVNTAEEAEYAVKAIKYPPWGERGAGLARAQCYGLHMGEYMQTANEEVMTIIMIEHIKAVENIEKILKVKGIDSVMIGALDLSGSMGILGQTDNPKVEDAIQKVLKASKQANVPCGIITVAPEQTNERIKQGFTNLIVGIDVLFLNGGIMSSLNKIKRS